MHDYEFITESNYIILPKVATMQWQQGVIPMGGSHQQQGGGNRGHPNGRILPGTQSANDCHLGLPEAPFVRQKCI